MPFVREYTIFTLLLPFAHDAIARELTFPPNALDGRQPLYQPEEVVVPVVSALSVVIIAVDLNFVEKS